MVEHGIEDPGVGGSIPPSSALVVSTGWGTPKFAPWSGSRNGELEAANNGTVAQW